MIVVLSGTSSSGKSTLARAVAARLAGPHVLIEADRSFPEVDGDADLSGIVVFHRAAATWAVAGYDVVLDGSLPFGDDALRDACLWELRPYGLHIIGVECSVEELRRREAVRPDERPAGWAESQRVSVNAGLGALLTVDTTDGDTSRQAADVIASLRD